MKHKMFLFFVAIFFLVSSSPLSAQQLVKVSFPYSPIGAVSLPWWIAKDGGFFEKQGLDVDMVFVGASPIIVQAMLGGQANVAGNAGPTVIANILSGGDIIQVATLVPQFTQSLVVRPEIKTIKELRGRKIGISRLGAVPHFTLQTILSYHGVKDITLVQTGGTPQAISSLGQKLVDGIIVSPPATYRLINEGYNEIVSHKDVANMGVEFLTNGIVARRSFANKNKDVVIRLIKGTMEGLKSMHSDAAAAKKVFSKYTRLTEPKLVDLSYRFALEVITKDPTVSAPSMQSIVKNLVQWNIVDATAAGNTPLTAFYDNSYVEEIKRSGFLAQLWK